MQRILMVKVEVDTKEADTAPIYINADNQVTVGSICQGIDEVIKDYIDNELVFEGKIDSPKCHANMLAFAQSAKEAVKNKVLEMDNTPLQNFGFYHRYIANSDEWVNTEYCIELTIYNVALIGS